MQPSDTTARALDREKLRLSAEIDNLLIELETAKNVISEYTKLFGDLATAQRIKAEYQRMLKREIMQDTAAAPAADGDR